MHPPVLWTPQGKFSCLKNGSLTLSDGAAIKLLGVSNVLFQDLIIKGGKGIIVGNADVKLQMTRCTVSGSTSHGIDMASGDISGYWRQSLEADNCIFTCNGGYGLHLYGPRTGRDDGIDVSAFLSKCSIHGNKIGSVLAHAPSDVEGSAKVTLHDCELDKPAEKRGYGEVHLPVTTKTVSPIP